MPSSSTHSTHLERHLQKVYKTTYSRLFYSGKVQELHVIDGAFADAMDVDINMLQATLNPRYGLFSPDTDLRERSKAGVKSWEDLAVESKRKSQVERIWSAGSCMAEVGACLFSVGRDKEAKRFCEMGDWLQNHATEIMHAEEERKRWTGREMMQISDDEF